MTGASSLDTIASAANDFANKLDAFLQIDKSIDNVLTTCAKAESVYNAAEDKVDRGEQKLRANTDPKKVPVLSTELKKMRQDCDAAKLQYSDATGVMNSSLNVITSSISEGFKNCLCRLLNVCHIMMTSSIIG